MENHDYTDPDERELEREKRIEKHRRKKTLCKVWRIVRPLLILAASVALCFFVVKTAGGFLLDEFVYPVDKNDATPITVEIPSGSGASTIGKILYEACGENEEGLINNKAIFTVYVDFTGKANKLKAGTYVLSKNMNISQMVDVICKGNPPKQTERFTVIEGITVNAISAHLVEERVIESPDKFLELCKNGDAFTDFSFINSLLQSDLTGRRYALEGYLFPDTYEVYTDATEKTIIKKMLVRFWEIFNDENKARAQELGMSIDQVVTLASVIEREANMTEDFAKVSAVFHNRMKAGQKLESCATMCYVLNVNKYSFSSEELATDSPYNTYMYDGLPAGPISNPGQTAIEAALYPNEEYLEEDYRYFCNMEVSEGNTGLVFARTYEEHLENVEKYSKYW